jgi:hypothetical protein
VGKGRCDNHAEEQGERAKAAEKKRLDEEAKVKSEHERRLKEP